MPLLPGLSRVERFLRIPQSTAVIAVVTDPEHPTRRDSEKIQSEQRYSSNAHYGMFWPGRRRPLNIRQSEH